LRDGGTWVENKIPAGKQKRALVVVKRGGIKLGELVVERNRREGRISF
jgi:hypothetical protein